jgi:hypothetical protein
MTPFFACVVKFKTYKHVINCVDKLLGCEAVKIYLQGKG